MSASTSDNIFWTYFSPRSLVAADTDASTLGTIASWSASATNFLVLEPDEPGFHKVGPMLATKCRLLLDPAMLMKIKILPNVDCRVIVQLESTNHSWMLWTEPRLRPTVANVFREEHSELALFEILHIRDGRPPIPIVCCWHSPMHQLRESTFCSCFIKSDLVWKSKWSLFPSRTDFETFCRMRESDEKFVAPKKLLMSHRRKSPLCRNASLFLSSKQCDKFPVLIGTWYELDIKFLFKMKKLAIVLNLLLAPVDPMVKPTEHEIVRRLNPIPGEVSRCFPSNHKLTPWSTGGTTKNWHLNPRVQWTDRLWCSACNPCLQQTAWACNLKKVVAQPKRHSIVAVDLRKIVLLTGRLVQEKQKKMPARGVIKCGRMHDIARWNVCFGGKTQSMCFVNWSMQLHGLNVSLYTLTTNKN